jgi:hypothetical protein
MLGLQKKSVPVRAVHGYRPVNPDEEVALEDASSRGKKKRTLTQANWSADQDLQRTLPDRFGYAVVRAHLQFDPAAIFNTRL